MTSLLRQREHIGKFGSLRDAVARAVQDPSALFVSRNTFHDVEGAIEKRPGRTFHGEVAAQSEPWCSPVLSLATDNAGELRPDVLYYVRYTYVTAAGETDDLHSIGPQTPGPAEARIEMTGGNNAIDVGIPFHLRQAVVTDHEVIDDTTVRFKIETPPVDVCDPDVFIGWLVYSRSPRIQDETHLGYNCNASEPLYHRHEKRHNGILGKITAYDPVTGWWTLDRKQDFGNSPHPDDNVVDIMMPDREGLPIRYFNVYISSDRDKFYYAGTGVTGTDLVRVLVHDETAQGAPSTRFPRAAPTVTAVDVTEAAMDGRCGDWPVLTNIEPGIYKVRTTFLVDDADVLRPPGLQVAQELLGEPLFCYPVRAAQETPPSCAAYVCVGDNQGILVQPPDIPAHGHPDFDYSFIDWRIYTAQKQPLCQLTMFGGLGTGDMGPFPGEDPERPYGNYFPDRDLAYSNALVQAHLPNVHTFVPIGSGSGAADGSGASNSNVYEGFRTGPANSCVNPEYNPFTQSWYINTPSYEDVVRDGQILDASGNIITSHFATRDDAEINRVDFNLWMEQCGEDLSGVTHGIFAVNFRIRPGDTDYYRPSTAPDSVTLYYYDYLYNTPREVKSSGWTNVGTFRTFYFCVENPYAISKSLGGEHYFSFYLVSENGVGMDFNEAYGWLYEVPDCYCGDTVLSLVDQRGAYDNQVSGGDPEDFGAWYSGDTDTNDAGIEAGITAATIDTIHPQSARNAPLWEEYGNSTQVPGHSYQPHSGTMTMGQDIFGNPTPGECQIPHRPSSYPGVLYGGFAIAGKVSGVDYTIDVYNGIVTSLTIPDGEVLNVSYEIPYMGWPVSTDPDSLTDGWVPSYHDVYRYLIADPRCQYAYCPLWASTRKNVAANRHHWWFRADDANIPSTAAYLKVEIRFRCREGGSGGLGAWNANVDTSRKIRLWDDAAYQISGVVSTSWIDLETGIGGADMLNEWVTRTYAIPYEDIRLTHNCGIVGGLDGDHKYFIVDMAAWDYNAFDVDYVNVFLVCDQTDEVPTEYELLRDIVPRGTDEWTLKNPMREKPELEWTGPWLTCEGGPRALQGEWVHVPRNTTGQWPITPYALPIIHGAGNAVEMLTNYIGCGDSVFEDNGDGTLARVFHVEGEYHGRTMQYDWRFSNWLSRVFFCNPGFPKYNFRFDGVQTFPMGIGWPYTKQDLADGLVDNNGNYDPPGDEDESITDEEDPCGTFGEQAAGEAISVSSIDTPEGEVPEGDETNTPVLCHDVEYYVVWKRVLKIKGRSYIVRSRPRRFTGTIEVCVHPMQLPSVRVRARFCPEPQVTHLEVYRNHADSAAYFLVQSYPIDTGGILDEENACVTLTIDDTIPVADTDLTQPMLLETGRPRAARLMTFHQGRNWIVPQEQGEVVDMTNVSDASGSVDPEGYWPLNMVDPPMREAAAITCLSPYHSVLIAHSRSGMVSLRGISTELNDSSAVVATALHAHAGFIGPDAWVLVDSSLIGMTHEGPSVVLGDEAKTFGTDEIDLEPLVLSADAGYNMRCVHNRTKGVSQVWFTYTDDPMILAGEKALVFDKDPDGGGGAILWKKWDTLAAFGLTRARSLCGDEYSLMGDSRGRLFAHGGVGTDAGVFIESEFVTGWYDEAERGRSHQPEINYWRVHGRICDYLFLDVHADGNTGRSFGDPGIPINMGGYISQTQEVDEPIYERRQWNTGLLWGRGEAELDRTGYWREQDKDYDEVETGHHGVFRMIQYRLYQTRDKLPAGVDPNMTYRIVGFIPFHRLHAPTNAEAGS